MVNALPTLTMLEKLTVADGKVVECGAGSGLWLYIMREFGIDAIGFDPKPCGPLVKKGSHLNLGAYSDRLLLIVWPPDGTDIQEWINIHGGRWFAFCGSSTRVLNFPTFKKGTVYYEDIARGVGRPNFFCMGEIDVRSGDQAKQK